VVAWIAIAVAAVGVFSTWTKDGPTTLSGIEGPNDGWLVLILAALALVWSRPLARGSWIGIIGVLGASLVMCWTALEDWLDRRDVFGASLGHGLVLVLAASATLAGLAVWTAVHRLRTQSPAADEART
jgi:hypothetical protein